MARLHRGFTLIELLVVIAIISILVAVIFPVFVTARQKAYQATCLSNERQIGLADMQYCDDNDEAYWNTPFPGAFNIPAPDPDECIIDACTGTEFWTDILMPYTQSTAIYVCPSNNDDPRFMDTVLYTSPTYPVNYGFVRKGIHADPDFGPWTMPLIQTPSEIAVLSDASYAWDYPNCEQDPEKAAGKGSWYFSHGDPNDVNSSSYGKPRHFDGMNFIYADGHAKWVKAAGATPPATGFPQYTGYYPGAKIREDDCTDFTQ